MGKMIPSTALLGKIMYRAVCVLLLSFSFIIAVALPVSAQGYPDPPPNFAHPETPHRPLYSPYGGSLDRPVLVIIRHFKDYPPDPNRDSAWAAERFFGRHSLNIQSYFLSNSFNKLFLWPAQETEGTVNDGIVVVYSDITVADFYKMSTFDMRKTGIEGAVPYVDFASFDTNGDGIVTNEELLIFQIHPPLTNEDCGQTAWTSVTLPNGIEVSLSVSQASSLAGFLTFVHELAHPALDFVDFYGYYNDAGFDPCEATCGLPDDTVFSYNAYNKLHFGWISPTVVTRDGFYEIHDTRETGEAFILYNYARGTKDYFVVENRRRAGYDWDVRDEGLVIWRIDEAKFADPNPNIKWIEPMSPVSGFHRYAWDPSDPATPERTMKKPWRDGTASRVAVRAIGPSGPVIRAYFDVRGPGILVDPSTATGTPMEFQIMRGEMSLIAVPVMNTGEAWDEFEFTLLGLPAGWVVTTQRLDLGPGVPATASIYVMPPADASLGGYAAQAQGRSTTDSSVHTVSPLTITIKLMPDLIETFVSNPPASVGRGDSFSVTDTVKNRGDAACGDSTTFYYLSLDRQWNATDKQLTGTRAVPGLVAGQSHTGTVLVSVPNDTSPATYYLLACADFMGMQSEGNETNNCIASRTRVQVTAIPDYVETSVTDPLGTIVRGGSFFVRDTVKNQGTAHSTQTSTTRYYLSKDIVRYKGDTLLTGTRSVPALLIGESHSGIARVTVPPTTPLGLYYVLACADDTRLIAESDETNNCIASSGRVQVTLPDYVETSVRPSQTTAGLGTSFWVEDTVSNQGLVASTEVSTTRYYLSPEPLKTKGGGKKLLKGSRTVPVLGPGRSSTAKTQVYVPTTIPLGSYRLMACADDTNVIDETDEKNNCTVSTEKIQITK